MEFCGSIVRALWHDVSPGILDATHSPQLPRLGAVCVLSMMPFALDASAGRPVDDQQDFFPSCSAVSYFSNAAFRNLHGGQDDDTTTCRH
jgi:hypothetical protein